MSTFVSISGGLILFQIDTDIAPVVVTPPVSSSTSPAAAVTGSLSVGRSECGCLSLFQIFYEYGGALVTETSPTSPNSPDLQPIITEDGLYYFVTEQTTMADPIKVSELDEADINDIIANLEDAEILLSYEAQSYKLTFSDLITIIKTAIATGKLTITVSGVSGTSATLVSKIILDAELNEQNISILAAIPVSGEQGLYVNTTTGAWQLYNLGDDLTGAALKILYSTQ